MCPRMRVLAIVAAMSLAGCGEQPTAPEPLPVEGAAHQFFPRGTGLVLNSLTNVPILVPILGEVVISEAVITGLAVDAVGGLVADVNLTLTGGVLGDELVTETFATELALSNTDSNRCSLLQADLAPVDLEVLDGTVATVDLPVADVGVQGTGPAGAILCLLGRLIDAAAPLRLVERVVALLNFFI